MLVAAKIKPHRFALAVFLLSLFSSLTLASEFHWFSTQSEAQSAFQARQTGNCTSGFGPSFRGNLTTMCSGTGSHYGYTWGNCSGTTDINYLYCSSGFNNSTCPTGATRQPDTGSCACPSGQTVINGVCSAPIVQDCPTGQYKSNNVCIAAPDCNSGHPEGGYYFAVSLGSCQSAVFDGSVLACSNSARPVACPPYDDCIATGAICSDNLADANKFLQDKLDKTPIAKAETQAAKTEAEASKNDATAAAAAKAAAAQAAQANNAAAQSAAQTGTAAALQTAAQAAAEAATAAAKAANSAQQKIIAEQKAAEAAAQDAKIPQNNDFPPGRAQNAADRARAAANTAKTASLDAISGNGTDGNTDDMGNCPDCAKESTLESLKAGTANTLNAGTPGEFDDTQPTEAEATAKAAYTTKVNEIKGEISQLIDLNMSGQGQLPSFDFGTIKGADVTVDFSRFSALAYIGDLIIFIAGFLAIRTLLDI